MRAPQWALGAGFVALLALRASSAGPATRVPDAGHAQKADGGAHDLLRHPVDINAEKLEVRNAKQEATWRGHVRVRSDSTRITCDELIAHYIEDQGNQEVARILCDGHVEALDGQKRVKGDHADFDNDTGVLVMTGRSTGRDGGVDGGERRVEVWDGNTHVLGLEATFVRGEDKLQVVSPITTIGEEQNPALKGRSARDGGR